MTYIPRQAKLVRERLEAKLERSLMQRLESYCTYLDSDRDYVISQALEVVFRKDKGFAEWLKSNDAGSFLQSADEGAATTVSGKRTRPGAGRPETPMA